MERVVYLLGAGFSAPLGLPVMGDFLIKSKDMYFRDEARYSHFLDVFKRIERMSIAKNYYETNLFNIEEILSILETEESIGAGDYRADFVKYLSDVIVYYTPSFGKRKNGAGNWLQDTFNCHSLYPYFVGSIMNAYILYGTAVEHGITRNAVDTTRDPQRTVEYSVVSLNYDLVLEQIWNTMKGETVHYDFGLESDDATVCLAKLHGSVNQDIMVAPTWNKSINAKAKRVWEAAYRALKTANQIRIIGYSLPVADAYVKYLLKAAVIHSEHLKNIDIILKGDNRMGVDFLYPEKLRYREFISFQNARISMEGVEAYLSGMAVGGKVGTLHLNALESVHEEFFRRTSVRLHS